MTANAHVTLLDSAARTASLNTADILNFDWKGVQVTIDVTAIVTAPTITVTIQGKDPLSGKYYTILASAAITTVSTNVLRVYPGCIAAANTVANDVLPSTWRVAITHGNANSITYSIGAQLIV